MKDSNLKKRLLIGGIITIIALAVLSVVGFLLAYYEVIKINPFKLMFAILTLGIGIVFTVYAIIIKGGYEFAVGGILVSLGIIIILIGILKWYIILIIAIALLFILLLCGLLLKSDSLTVTRTNEEEGYKPYGAQKEIESKDDNEGEKKE